MDMICPFLKNIFFLEQMLSWIPPASDDQQHDIRRSRYSTVTWQKHSQNITISA